MSQSSFRSTRLRLATAAAGLLWGMLACRGALATDITTPASVNGITNPMIVLNQTGDGLLSPPYQWTMKGNDQNYSVNDATGANTPFQILSGCPSNTLSLFNGGVAIGATYPEQKLHIRDGGVRFEDTNVFQKWDLFADATAFELVDFTNASHIPFSVLPGAPHRSLFINSNGNIGLGTGTPTAGLHLVKAAQATTAEILARFETTDDSIGGLFIANNSAGDGLFVPKITGRSASQNAALINEAIITNDVALSPAIVYNAAKGAGGALVTRPLVVYRNNSVAKVTIAANGDVFANGFNPVSSRTLKHDIKDLGSQKASDALRQLTPVEFVYNDDETAEERVGFIAEDVPEIVANKDRQSVPIMDVVALVTRVVKDQQQAIDEQKMSIAQQQKTIVELMKRLEALEGQASATK